MALQQFVNHCKKNIRSSDYLGRLGGDEFAVILSDVDIDNAEKMVSRLQHSLRNHPIAAPHGEIFNLTMSIGIATYQPGLNMSEFVAWADKALYQAKERGRNCFVTLNLKHQLTA